MVTGGIGGGGSEGGAAGCSGEGEKAGGGAPARLPEGGTGEEEAKHLWRMEARRKRRPSGRGRLPILVERSGVLHLGSKTLAATSLCGAS